jgi:hypothetical protein
MASKHQGINASGENSAEKTKANKSESLRKEIIAQNGEIE